MITTDIHPILCALLAGGCLAGLFFVGAFFYVALRERKQVTALLQNSPPFLWGFVSRLCPNDGINVFLFFLICTRHLLTVFYVIFYGFAVAGFLFPWHLLGEGVWNCSASVIVLLCLFLALVASIIALSDLLPRTLAFYSPDALLKAVRKPAGFFLALLFPINILACRLVASLSTRDPFSSFSEPNEQLLDLVEGIEGTWTEHDKRLLQSVLNFRNRIAREIMKPRVGLFCIPENLLLYQAAELLQREGYSRVPVYRDTIDTIVGVLFYKDVLSKYAAASDSGVDREKMLATPVKTLVKKVFYCPETKKIASLLQEFRKRQTHIAVVVDEYGGTAGLVTIEDILEEIVGEIADEYDEQEALFSPAPGGGWIVDARMNLLDVEEELGIKIPQEEDYDTLAGYVFYRVGSIPQAGLVLHHDAFEIEILKSNDRMVEEVKIIPIANEAEKETSEEG